MNPIDLAISQLEDLRQSLASLELDLASAREERDWFRVERNKLRSRVAELEAKMEVAVAEERGEVANG
jgi:regulator of replication initiation timing